MLTKGLDNVTGTSGNDTIVGAISANAELNILNALDIINGGAGTDTLQISHDAGDITAGNLSNVEIIQIDSASDTDDAASFNASTINGLTNLNYVRSLADFVATAADSTDVSVSGAQAGITVKGGKNVVVTDSTDGEAITLSTAAATGNAVGTITVTDTKQGAGIITVDGGSTVTVTATTNATGLATSGIIAVGDNKAASGAVTVTQNLNTDGSDALTGGNVSVTGGTTVNVTSNLVATAKDETVSAAHAFGNVSVLSEGKTTDVTVVRSYAETEVTKAGTAEIVKTSVVTFEKLDKDASLTINGLTFTAAKNLTAEQVAAAFANLTTTDTQSASGPTANGVYTGSNTAGWTSGAVSGKTVTFTAAAFNTDNLDDGDATQVPSTNEAEPVPDVKSNNSVGAWGSVVINDDTTTASIKTITLDGFAAAILGGSGSLDALTTLNLANSAGNTTLTSTSKTLAVKANNLEGGDVVLGANVETLTLTTEGKSSNIDLVADAVKSLTIDAGVALTLQAGTNFDGALETVAIKSAGAVNLGDISGVTALKSFSAADSTGGVTATITADTANLDATFAKYVFSQGADTVTLADVAVGKAIELGNGDDSIALAEGVRIANITATIDGGAGTNTLVLEADDAKALSADNAFNAKIDKFQHLTIGAAAAQELVNLDNIDGISYVKLGGSTPILDGETIDEYGITLDNLANDGTVVLTAAGAVLVNVKDAGEEANTSDVLNLVAGANTSADDVALSVLAANNVETVKITTNDTLDVDGKTYGNSQSLTLVADSATTLTLNGAGNLELTLDAATVAVETVNASGMTGSLTFTAGLNDLVVTGGSGADDLTADANDVKLYGGAGKDTLTVESGLRVNLYGGDGADTFVINAGASSTLDAYTVINGVASGDVIKLAGANDFSATKIALSVGADDTLLNYANQAVKTLAEGEMGWFQRGENTFIVLDVANEDVNSDAFKAGEDIIVMITGKVDLGTSASYNIGNILEIA